jgi:hypothetical protein
MSYPPFVTTDTDPDMVAIIAAILLAGRHGAGPIEDCVKQALNVITVARKECAG